MKQLTTADHSKLSEIFKANQKLPGAPSWTDSQVSKEAADQLSIAARNPSGELIAFILFRETPEAYEISYLATNPQVKRQGVMGGLLRGLIDLAGVSGLKVWLEVHEGNEPARKLYEKIGFKEAGRRPKYYSDGGSAILYNYG